MPARTGRRNARNGNRTAMLNILRKGAQSLPAKILMALLVLSFAIWGINYSSFSQLRQSVVALVGDTEVTAKRFGIDLQREQSQLTRQSRQPVTMDQMRATGMDRAVLGSLVREAAFREEEKRLGIEAPDSAVARAIRQDPSFKNESGAFDKDRYRYLLSQLGYSESQFESLIRGKLIRRMLEQTAAAGVAAPPGVAERIAAWQGEERTVTILSLPLDTAPDPGQPDDAALSAFYDANAPMFTEPERRSGDYLEINAAELLKTLMPDEAALREAYEAEIATHKANGERFLDQITFPDRSAAEAAVARLKAGEATFETLAAEQGDAQGDMSLGWIKPEDLPAAAATALGDTKSGIVGPVELPAGFVVYRVRESQPFEDVRDRIGAEKAQEALYNSAPELANKVDGMRAEGLTFKEIADRAGPGVNYGTFAGLARDGSLADGGKAEGVTARKTFLDEAFTALDGEDRDLVEMPDSGYVLVLVREIDPSHLLPLDQVKDRAIEAWKTDARKKAIAAKGEELAKRLGENASIWDLGEELGLTPEALPPFTQLAPPDLPADLTAKLFRTPVAGGASAMAADGNAAIVAQMSNIAELAPADVEQTSGSVGEMLDASLQGDAAEYFDRAIMARHPATLNTKVVDDILRRLGASISSEQ